MVRVEGLEDWWPMVRVIGYVPGVSDEGIAALTW
jgi:hypothetical protein